MPSSLQVSIIEPTEQMANHARRHCKKAGQPLSQRRYHVFTIAAQGMSRAPTQNVRESRSISSGWL